MYVKRLTRVQHSYWKCQAWQKQNKRTGTNCKSPTKYWLFKKQMWWFDTKLPYNFEYPLKQDDQVNVFALQILIYSSLVRHQHWTKKFLRKFICTFVGHTRWIYIRSALMDIVCEWTLAWLTNTLALSRRINVYILEAD